MTKLNEIILIVGKKRFIFVVILLAFTAALGGAWQSWMNPHYASLSSQKSALESDRMRLQREITDIPVKYKQLGDNEARYQKFLDRGFTLDQDRIFARSEMDTMRVKTGLRGIKYNISPQQKVKPPEGVTTEDTIISSGIEVEMKGLTDLEMRDFAQKMTKEFRGLVILKKLELKASDPVTRERLADLSNKKPVDFVTGKASFDWYTIVPKPVDENAAGAAPGMTPGGPPGMPGGGSPAGMAMPSGIMTPPPPPASAGGK